MDMRGFTNRFQMSPLIQSRRNHERELKRQGFSNLIRERDKPLTSRWCRKRGSSSSLTVCYDADMTSQNFRALCQPWPQNRGRYRVSVLPQTDPVHHYTVAWLHTHTHAYKAAAPRWLSTSLVLRFEKHEEFNQSLYTPLSLWAVLSLLPSQENTSIFPALKLQAPNCCCR